MFYWGLSCDFSRMACWCTVSDIGLCCSVWVEALILGVNYVFTYIMVIQLFLTRVNFITKGNFRVGWDFKQIVTLIENGALGLYSWCKIFSNYPPFWEHRLGVHDVGLLGNIWAFLSWTVVTRGMRLGWIGNVEGPWFSCCKLIPSILNFFSGKGSIRQLIIVVSSLLLLV